MIAVSGDAVKLNGAAIRFDCEEIVFLNKVCTALNLPHEKGEEDSGGLGLSYWGLWVQGCLAHKKQPPPAGPP